ncbi:MAG: hypothetical protein AB7V18_12150 [Pyrinomonadaceae bacterium]
MNPKKSQNSLLILTTLGVYLGLLMVGGAAPQVFAHSATTRNFEISDEIEVKDDLDRDPGETNLPAPSDNSDRFSEFANAYAEFVLAEYDDHREFGEKMQGDRPGGCRLSYLHYFTSFAPIVERFFNISDYSGQTSWNGDELHRQIEIKYSPARSELSGLHAAFANDPCCTNFHSRAQRLIIQNSAVSVDAKNRHLVIVTRLPRAGLDALLAKDAK